MSNVSTKHVPYWIFSKAYDLTASGLFFKGEQKMSFWLKGHPLPNCMALLQLQPSKRQRWRSWMTGLFMFTHFLGFALATCLFPSLVLTNMLNKFWLKNQNQVCGWHPESKISSQLCSGKFQATEQGSYIIRWLRQTQEFTIYHA